MNLKSYCGAEVGIYLCGSVGNYIIYYHYHYLKTWDVRAWVWAQSRKYTAIVLHHHCINQSYQSQLSTFIHKSSFYCTQEAIQTALLKLDDGLDNTFVLPFRSPSEVFKEPQCYKMQSYRGSQMWDFTTVGLWRQVELASYISFIVVQLSNQLGRNKANSKKAY